MVRRLAVLALVAGALFAVQLPADALNGAGCQAKGTASFSPALTNPKTRISYSMSGALNKCRSLDPITAGTISAWGVGDLSCKKAGTTAGSFSIRWNDGRTSSGVFDAYSFGPNFVFQGKVTSGAFAGAADTDGLAAAFAMPTIPADCAAGLSSAKFTGGIGVGNIV